MIIGLHVTLYVLLSDYMAYVDTFNVPKVIIQSLKLQFCNIFQILFSRNCLQNFSKVESISIRYYN